MGANKTSENGFKLIESEEGRRLSAYKDLAGFMTIGVGHRILPNEYFPPELTNQEVDLLLCKDVRGVEHFLNQTGLDLNQNQYDALVDFGFNLGCGSLRDLLSHGIEKIPTEIIKWDHAAGKVVNGLLTRREKELLLWNKPVTPVTPVTPLGGSNVSVSQTDV